MTFSLQIGTVEFLIIYCIVAYLGAIVLNRYLAKKQNITQKSKLSDKFDYVMCVILSPFVFPFQLAYVAVSLLIFQK